MERQRTTPNPSSQIREMMRFPGNSVAKEQKLQNFRVARSQYRHCSSMSQKDVQMGDFELLVDNMAGLFFKGAYGVVDSCSILIKMKKHNDEREKDLELMRQRHLERNRIVSSRNVHTVEGKHTSI
ncbi:expressed protein [Arabidopsis lyrata subsp. lyrata]|uniref:Expressed protein n=1 Tax=Arabidopsis lyrata subsp. lyrata TaxID=81972 RepID=D7MD31_ARALL|nr:expressed protein [Arabidopsis lyrata subsp. lyrata]